MESNRRFRRPRIVVRAVRKLRARAASISNGRVRNAPPQASAAPAPDLHYPHPHLSLVTEAPEGQPAPAPARRKPRIAPSLLLLLLMLLSIFIWWLLQEIRTSSLQAQFFANMVKKVHYQVEPGPSNAIRFPSDSPYDERLGYANLPDYLAKLKARDYEGAAQARLSPKMI